MQESTTLKDKPVGVSPRRSATAAFLGSVIEFYDFFIYGTAAAVVFGTLFFSDLSPAVGTLVAFSTLAVGYLVRPLGAIVFGHIGDRKGRKAALMGTLYTMGGATVLIGLVPSSAAIGDFAAILLILLRIVQGLGLGGEMGNAAALTMESSPPKRRGFFSSFTYAGGFVGMVIATGAFALVSMLPNEAFMAWGWRMPFLFSGVLLLITYIARRQLVEPPVLEQVKEKGKVARVPFVAVIKNHKKDVFLATLIAGAPNTVYYTVTVFSISYAVTTYGASETIMLVLVAISSAVLAASVPMWGALSDRIGRYKLVVGGLLAEAVFTLVYFLLLGTADPIFILIGMLLVLVFGHGVVNGVLAAFFTELFPVEVRSTAVSLGQQLGGALSGLAPMIASAIIIANPDGWYLIVLYVGGMCLLGAVAAYMTIGRWRSRNTTTTTVETVDSSHAEMVTSNR